MAIGRRALIAACVLLAGCSEQHVPAGRVLVIGIDGASLRLIRPLLDEGRLPHLAKIVEAGASGPLLSFFPLLSPSVWTTVATGKTPEQHGIRGWVTRDDTGDVRLYASHDRKVHALWNIVSDAGLEVGVVNWLMTYPPEKIRGVMISDHALPEAAQSQRNIGQMFARGSFGESLAPPLRGAPSAFFPQEWVAKVAEMVSTPAKWNEEIRGDDARSLRWVTGTNIARDREIVNIALAIDAERQPDVLMVLIQGIDRVSHALWAAVEPAILYPPDQRISPSKRVAWGNALRDYYVQTDAWIGELVARFGPDDLVLVLSDHGFEAAPGEFGSGNHVTPQSREAVLFASGRGIRAGESTNGVTVNDIAPTVLAWLGLPLAADMEGRPADFLAVTPPEPIASYDTTPIERVTDSPSGAEREILQQLEALGYLE
jgi:predicted AlkP superfamily phosphohydrolase/phosphomutase